MADYVIHKIISGYSPKNRTCKLIQQIRDVYTNKTLDIQSLYKGKHCWYPANLWDIDNETVQFTIVNIVSTAGIQAGECIIVEQGINLFCSRQFAISNGWITY